MRQVKMAEISSRSRLATVLLAFPLLGIFGAHRFYIGKPITAIVMLILSVLYMVTARFWGTIMFIPLAVVVLWALIDFIFAVSGIMKDNKGRRIKSW